MKKSRVCFFWSHSIEAALVCQFLLAVKSSVSGVGGMSSVSKHTTFGFYR